MQTEAAPPSTSDSENPPQPERFIHRLRQTWELELVISGAVAFTLLQLPALVDQTYDRLEAHLAGNLLGALDILNYYTKLALFTLIATFLFHIIARAYWVGLVGLEAVFPRGPRWDKLNYGPIGSRFYRERLPSLPSLIERVDDFCSVIFSFSFTMVLLFAVSIFWAGVLGLAAFVISRLFFGGERMGEVFRILGIIVLVPVFLAGLLDRMIGGRLEPAGPLARLIRELNRFYYHGFGMGLSGPIMMTLISNVRKKTIYPVIAVTFLCVFIAFLLSDLTRDERLSLDSAIYMPGEPGVNPEYYENQRPQGEVYRRTPSIQSDVVVGPYVRLFIPYYPESHNPALERRCPGVEPLREEGLRLGEGGAASAHAAGEVLRCFAEIHRVALDGKPLVGLDLHFSTHPKSGVRGVVAYIPTVGLSRGSHLLKVEAVPPAEIRKGDRPPEPYLIRFWI